MLRAATRALIAEAGPGPASLQFRQRLAASARLAHTNSAKTATRNEDAEVASRERRSAKQSRPKTQHVKPPRPTTPQTQNGSPTQTQDRNRQTPPAGQQKQQSPRAKTASSKASKTKGKEELVPKLQEPPGSSALRTLSSKAAWRTNGAGIPLDDDAIPLSPPRSDVDVEARAEMVVRHLRNKKFARALDEWGHLLDLGVTADVGVDALGRISDGVVAHIERTKSNAVCELYHANPLHFELLRNMATEAAVHDKSDALLAFNLALLRGDQPHLAANTYDTFKDRARLIHGIDINDLKSPDRAKRVAARLDGEGQLPLLVAHIAALTMLDRFRHSEVIALLQTNANLFNQPLLRPVLLSTAKVFNGKPGAQRLRSSFMSNCQSACLAVYCYHSIALVLQIRSLSSPGYGGFRRTVKLYYAIMKASEGPNRIIVPVMDAHYADVVPLTMTIWFAFITAFTRLKRPDMIMHLIDVDVPERHGQTPVRILVQALSSLSMVWRSLPKQRHTVADNIADVWRRIVARGAELEPAAVQARVTALRATGQTDGYEALCTRYKAELRRLQDTDADNAVDPDHFAYLCQRGKFSEAQAVLAEYRMNGATRLARVASRTLVASATRSMRLTYPQRRRLLTSVLQRFHPGVHIGGTSSGRILAFLLEGGKPVVEACAQTCRYETEASTFFSKLVRSLLSVPGGAVPSPCLEAAVHILEEHVPTDTMIAGTRYVAIWGCVVDSVAHTTTVSAAERHALLERAIAAFPLTTQSFESHLVPVLRHAIVSSLRRGDPDGVPEAVFWWKRMVDIPGSTLDAAAMGRIVQGFLLQGYPDTAADVVEDIGRVEQGVARIVLLQRHTWSTRAFEAVLSSRGLVAPDASAAKATDEIESPLETDEEVGGFADVDKLEERMERDEAADESDADEEEREV